MVSRVREAWVGLGASVLVRDTPLFRPVLSGVVSIYPLHCMWGGKTFGPFAAPEKVHGFSLRCRLERGPEDWTGVIEKEDAHHVFPSQLTPSSPRTSRPEFDNPQVLPVPGIVFLASLRTSRAISLTEDLCRLNIQPRWVTRMGEIWGRFNDACCRIST